MSEKIVKIENLINVMKVNISKWEKRKVNSIGADLYEGEIYMATAILGDLERMISKRKYPKPCTKEELIEVCVVELKELEDDHNTSYKKGQLYALRDLLPLLKNLEV